MSFLSFLFAFILVIQRLVIGTDVPGWTAMAVAIFFAIGLQSVSSGLLEFILVMSIGKLNNGHAMSSVQFLAWDLQFLRQSANQKRAQASENRCIRRR